MFAFNLKAVRPVWISCLCLIGSFGFSQTNCGNITITILTKDESAIYSNDGSYDIILSGGPGSYDITAVTGESCQADPINCVLFGGSYCDEVPCVDHYTIHLDSVVLKDTIHISDLSAGTYHITIADNESNCHYQYDAVINQPTCELVLDTMVTGVTAPNSHDGKISVNVFNGSGNVRLKLYTLGALSFPDQLIDSGLNNYVFDNLPIGDYIILGEDEVQCQKDIICKISGNYCDILHTIQLNQPGIPGGNDGSIIIDGTSSNGIVRVSLLDLLNNNIYYSVPHTFTGLSAGDYYFDIKDISGCQVSSGKITLSNPSCNFNPIVYTNSANDGIGGQIIINQNGGTDTVWANVLNENDSSIYLQAFTGDLTLHNLPSGDYLVVLFPTDRPACIITQNVTVNNVVNCSSFTGILSKSDVSTYKGSDGSISASASGSHGNVTIVLNGDCEGEIFSLNTKIGLRSKKTILNDTLINSGTFSNLSPGEYHVCFKDNAGCESIEYINIGSASCSIQSTVSSANPTANNANGSIAVTASVQNSSEDVHIFISRENYGTVIDGFNSITAYNLTEGTYLIYYQGENYQYCYDYDTIFLNDGLNCDINLSVDGFTGVSQYGAHDGTITANGTSSNGTVTISLGGMSVTGGGTFSNLGPGSYQLTAIDESGCTTSSSPYTISSPRCQLSLSYDLKLPTPGNNNGEIMVTASGVTDTVYIVMSVPSVFGPIPIASGRNKLVVKNLEAFLYLIAAYTDDYQYCTSGGSVDLKPACGLNALATGFNTSAPFSTDGAVIVGFNGEIGPVTIAGPGTKSSYNTFSNLGPGSYTYTVTDAAGCTASATATVSAPECFDLIIIKNHVSVYGGTDGSAIALSNGGSQGNITFQLYKNGLLFTTLFNAGNFSGLSAGTYSIIAHDEGGCFAEATFMIGQPNCNFDTATSVVHVTLHGGTDGKIHLAATGGLGIVHINIQSQIHGINSTQVSPAAFNGLRAGIYTIYIFDEVSCRDTFNLTVNQPECDLKTTIIKKNVSTYNGQDGEIKIKASNGIAPYIFTLKRNNIFINSLFSNDSIRFYNLGAGTYTVTTEDNGACSITDTILITQPICSAAYYTFSATACNNYEWMGTVYSESGTYTKSFTSTSGCDSILTLMLTIHNSSVGVLNITSCNTYSILGQSYTTSGVYILHTTNSYGCDSTITLNLSINHSVNIQMAVSACTSYTWHGMVYTQTGDYVKILTGSNGCDSTVTLHLTIKQLVYSVQDISACAPYFFNGQNYTEAGYYEILILGQTSNGCDSNTLVKLTLLPEVYTNLSIYSCGLYNFNGILINQSGVYRDTLISSSGCDSIVTLTIQVNKMVRDTTFITTCNTYTWPLSQQTYSQTGFYEIISDCHSTTLALTILPGSNSVSSVTSCGTYTWSANGQQYNLSGHYIYVHECDTQTLLLSMLPFINDTTKVTSCNTFYWSVNNQLYSTSGIYTYVTGCTIKVLALTIIPLTTTVTSITACGRYTWPVNGITYFSTTNDSIVNGCSKDILHLIINPTPAKPIISFVPPGCNINSGNITITNTTPGSTYSFNAGSSYQTSATRSNLTPGTYILQSKNSAGCISDTTIVILSGSSTLAAPMASVNRQPNCSLPYGRIVVSNPANGVVYSFDGGVNYQSSRTKDSLVPGTTYLITIKSTTTGCISDAATISIGNLPAVPIAPVATVSKSPTCTLPYGTITITTPTSGHSYSFDNGFSFQSSRIKDSLPINTSYLIKVKSTTTGCISDAANISIGNLPAVPTAPVATVSKSPTCALPYGTITITTPTSGHSYSFDNGFSFQSSRIKDSLPINTSYLIKVKSTTTGCISDAATISIGNLPAAPTVPVATVSKSPTCTLPYGTITITTPTNGHSYSFDNGFSFQSSRIKDSLPINTSYLIKVKSTTTGCISDAATISIGDLPAVPTVPVATVSKSPTCALPYGTITITTPTSGHSYSFDNGFSFQSSRIKDSLPINTSYLIKVKSTTTGCISDAANISIGDLPAVPIAPVATVSKSPTCTLPYGTITITTPTSGHSYSFDNGFSFQSSRIKDSLPINTSYLIKVKSTTTGCISDAATISIGNLPAVPTVPVATVSKSPTCTLPYGTITITTPTSGHSYSFDNGFSFQSSRIKDSLPINTSYLIKVKSTTTGCISDAATISIGDLPAVPTAPVATVSKSPTCALPYGTITITTPTSGHSYSFDNGFSFQSSRIKDSLPINTSYLIKVKSTTTGCISDAATISIGSLPAAPTVPVVTVSKSPTCALPYGTITITTPTSGHSYSFDNGFSFQSSRIKDSLPINTSYLIKVKSTTTGCISDAANISIGDLPAVPTVPVATVSKSPTCALPYGTITITTPTSGHSYSFDNGFSFQSSRIKDSLPINTSYLIKVKSTTTGCISDAATISIGDLPATPSAPVVIVSKSPTCTAQLVNLSVTSPVSGYTYSFDNGSSYQSSRNKNNLSPGTYLIKVKNNTTSCISEAIGITADSAACTNFITQFIEFRNKYKGNRSPKGLQDHIENNSMQIYPNPAVDFITIDLKESVISGKIVSLRIINSMGITLKQISPEIKSQVKIDISDFSSGIYYIQCQIDGEIVGAKQLLVR